MLQNIIKRWFLLLVWELDGVFDVDVCVAYTVAVNALVVTALQRILTISRSPHQNRQATSIHYIRLALLIFILLRFDTRLSIINTLAEAALGSFLTCQ